MHTNTLHKRGREEREREREQTCTPHELYVNNLEIKQFGVLCFGIQPCKMPGFARDFKAVDMRDIQAVFFFRENILWLFIRITSTRCFL